MNKRQKEILQSQVKDEKKVLKELKQIYEKAARDIDVKIADLLARQDIENLASIIYQLDYQKALKAQINVILDELNVNQFTSISEYLAKCYEEGFLGTLYDLQGQGVPLIFPIDQEEAVRAITVDSKLSKKLYTRLGEDVTELKKTVRMELSRGIAQAYSYAQIARNIRNQTTIGFNRSMRIARTEGHRVTQQATFDSQHKAKAAGADVVKQWDSTLDGRTRPLHRQLNGQIRELDEPFEINGRQAMYPGGFGIASMDVNCRCVLLQRARWALEDEEFESYTKRIGTGQLVDLSDAENFAAFKERYQDVVINEVLEKALRSYCGGQYGFYCNYSQALMESQEKAQRVLEMYGGSWGEEDAKTTQKIMDIIKKQPLQNQTLYRIESSKWYDELGGYKEGDVLTWGIRSTSRDRAFIDNVLNDKDRGVGLYSNGKKLDAVVYEITGKSHSLNVSAYSEYQQSESLVTGKYKVKKVTVDTSLYDEWQRKKAQWTKQQSDKAALSEKYSSDPLNALDELGVKYETFTSKKGNAMIKIGDYQYNQSSKNSMQIMINKIIGYDEYAKFEEFRGSERVIKIILEETNG